MNSLEIYERCVIDLDKYDTPTFEIVDFNRYAERALYEYINEKYKEFEMVQKRTDDLRQFVVFNTFPNTNNVYITLPNDYLRLLSVWYYIEDFDCNTDRWVIVQKTTADKLGYSENNYYWKPKLTNPQYQIIGNNLYFRVGDDDASRILQVRLEYIAIPTLYYIDPITLVPSNPPYTDEVDMQIIDKIVRIFQSATNIQGYQVSTQELSFKNN
jgi:hypothetical protein